MEALSDKTIKHLEMLQGVINRMAHNSFLLKGWAITLTAASFWLVGRGEFPVSGKCGIAAIIFTFWGLDAYYLRQERLFRKLYKHVSVGNSHEHFSMECGEFEKQIPAWWEMCYNWNNNPTGVIFHSVLLVAVVFLL